MLKATRARSRYVAWIPVVVVLLAALVWACSGSDGGGVDPGATSSSSGSTTSSSSSSSSGSTSGTSGASSSGTSGSTSSGSLDDASASGSSGDAGGNNTPATIPTEANLKIAFIGDTGTGNDFKAVLQLIKREQADAIMIQGDLNYALVALDPAKDWYSVIDGELAGSNIPYFLAKGNHDVRWNDYGGTLKTKFNTWGITPENGDPTTKNYSVVWKGLKMVFVDDTDGSGNRAAYAQARLAADAHIWKICAWHKNQRASNVGPKSDEMGWAIYEHCRNAGAIVAQAHSHTYSRSKTLISDTNQTVDSTCGQPFELCVANGKNFFFDSSVGGEDTRDLETSVSDKPYWGQTFTGNFGALFIEFNVDGDAKKAKGYFKTVGDVVVDPPAGSGKTFFTITRQ